MNQGFRQEIQHIVQIEEQRISKTLPGYGIGIVEIARSIDSYSVLTLPSNDLPDTTIEIFELGINKALDIALQNAKNYPLLPLVPSDLQLGQWADSFIVACGKVAMCEFMLELNRVKLCSIEQNENGFLFRLNSSNTGLESIERSYFGWHIEQAFQEQRKFIGQHRRERIELAKEMRSLVQMSHRFYMTYDTRPHIDQYYTALGQTQTAKMIGYDSFPKQASFGGIEFQTYCKAVELFAGWSMKHVDFAHLMLQKRTYLNPRNLYTLINPNHRITEYLQAALGMEESVCNQIISVMTLSLDNMREHYNGPSRFVMPTYIAIGDNRLITPVWGSIVNPFLFLLTELKRRYPLDWFRNVNTRENMFREELYHAFIDERFIKIDKPIKIKINGRVVTDIDAIIYDKVTCAMGLFQLKFQDLFGKSLRQRSNRKDDMLKANKWVTIITEWLNEVQEKELQQQLQLRHFPIKKGNIRLFILGKYAAHFSGNDLPDTRAAWGIWLQVKRILAANPVCSLDRLFEELKNQSPYNVARLSLEDNSVIIGNTEFTITER